MTDSLNDVEIAAVQAFYENTGMRESVKKIMLDGIYGQGTLKPGVTADPLHNRALVIVQDNPKATDEEMGRAMKVWAEAVSLLQHAFNQMSGIKTKVEKPEPKKNPAR